MRIGIAIGLLLALMLALQLSLGWCVQEDAFISFRYARNLVEGHGLVYNPGEPVEGYTNFLWTMLLAGGIRLNIDPLPLSRFAGMAFSVALVVLVGWFARRTDAPRGMTGGLVAAAIVASSPAVISEGVQGLETVCFAFLVTAGVLLTVAGRRGEAEGATNAWIDVALGSAILGLSALTRPEGVGVWGLATLGAILWRWRGGASPFARTNLAAIAAFALIYVPYWLWRFDTYGYPFPNTFYAKTGGGLDQAWRGLRYVGSFFLANPVLSIVSAWVAVRAARTSTARASRDPLPLTAGVVVLGYLVYVAVVGGDFKETYRFVVPVLPLGALLIDRALSGDRGRAARVWPWIVGVAVVANGLLAMAGYREWAAERHRDLQRRTLCGKALAEIARPGDTLAIHSAGIIPYYSRLKTIDMWGINDLHIARQATLDLGKGVAGHERGDWRYVFAQNPTYYVDEWYFTFDRAIPDLPKRVLVPRDAARYVGRSVPLNVGDDRTLFFNFVELRR